MIKYFFCIILFASFFSCGSSGENTKKQEANPAKEQVSQGFRSIPQEIIMDIWNNADLLDYIFLDFPFSMSQDQQASIRTNVSYIGREAQSVIPEGCKPMARQFFGKQGNIFLEADIYFNDNCRFYVFFIDGKATYANKMSQEGVQFFNTMISQALKASQGG